jgi:hypothetical protein
VDHRSRYQGKNLLYLLLSFGVPILLLYFSLTASVVARESQVGRQNPLLFDIVSRAFATLFYGSQFCAAWYLTRIFFPSRATKTVAAFRYIAVLLGTLFCSMCGAVACEAFGYDLFLRVTQRELR